MVWKTKISTELPGDPGSGGMTELLDDATPQLGGDLDVNGNDITTATALNFVASGSPTFKFQSGSSHGVVAIEANGTGSAILRFQDDTANRAQLLIGDGDYITFQIGSTLSQRWHMVITPTEMFHGDNANGPALINEAASATNPTFAPDRQDENTGVVTSGADSVGFAAGAIEACRYTEVSSHVLASYESQTGITAFSGGGQASATQLLSSYNDVTTVAAAGDSVKLPATPILGMQVWVFNAGANSMNVFPGSGDDLGAGTDTAVAVAAGSGAMFLAISASLWRQFI